VIEIRDGLAIVDYAKNDETETAATARCPTGAIRWIEGAQSFCDRFAGAVIADSTAPEAAAGEGAKR
jgi:hypothetical protein